MKSPRPGHGKDYAVKWVNVGNGETMYSGAMTKEAAEHLATLGHWHSKAFPVVEDLRDRLKNSAPVTKLRTRRQKGN